MPTNVVNVRRDYFDVYIGRETSYRFAREHQNRGKHLAFGEVGSMGKQGYFGNPFPLKAKCDMCGKVHYNTEQGRKDLLACYKKWFWFTVNDDPKFRELVKQLKDKGLGCWCHPQACHGDVIKAWLDAGCPMDSKPALLALPQEDCGSS